LGSFARWAFVMVTVVMAACSSPATSESPDLACLEQICVYDSREAKVCRQACSSDAASRCPEGQVCTTAGVCCGDTPAKLCDSPPVQVCCPASGC